MRLTRRAFIQASAATSGLLAAGCATQPPVSAAMAPRKMKAARPAKGEWVASTCQGCTQWCAIQIFVQDGRAVRVRGNPLSKTNHGYCLPARAPDPAAGLRPRPDQGAAEAHQPGQGPRRRPEVRADHLGRGARHGRRQADGTAPDDEAHKLVYIRGRYSSTSTDLLYGALPAHLRHRQLLLAQRDLRRGREDGAGTDAGLFRLSRLRPREDAVPGGVGLPIRSPRTGGAEHDPPLRRDPRSRHGDRGRSAPVQRRRQGARVAAGHARHGRRAGRRDGARAADRGAVEPRVRRRLQGRQEPVRRRQDGRRGGLRREGDLRPGEVVEPRAEGPHAGLGGEGDADPGGADRPRRPRDGQGGAEDRRCGWARAWR